MKTYILSIIFIIFILDCMFAQKNAVSWNFPICPGTDEWKELITYEERLNAYNIPNEIISKINTYNLVQTCINYPEFRLIMTRNSLQSGYDYIKSIFNGFEELEKRTDSGKELIKIYKEMKPEDILQFNTPAKRGAFSFQFTFIELIISQKNVLLNLTKEDKIDIINACIEKYEKKRLSNNNYSIFGLKTSILILGRLLDLEKYEIFDQIKQTDEEIQHFLYDSNPANIENFELIKNCAKEYLKQLSHE